MAIGAYGVGQLFAAISGGHLADTLGRRKTIVLSMFSVAVVYAVVLFPLISQSQQVTNVYETWESKAQQNPFTGPGDVLWSGDVGQLG